MKTREELMAYAKKNSTFTSAPRGNLINVCVNVGLGLDIQTCGNGYMIGVHGEALLPGGLAALTGVVALPNYGKTALSAAILANAMRSMAPMSSLHFHDAEQTADVRRLDSRFKKFDELSHIDVFDIESPFFLKTDPSVYEGGEELYSAQRDTAKARSKQKDNLFETQFIDPSTGKPLLIQAPIFNFVDSMSSLTMGNELDMHENNEVGSSGMNMSSMRGGSAKSQMFETVVSVMIRGGMYYLFTGHIGQDYGKALDARATDMRKLKGIKEGFKLKKVPENALFYAHNTWYIINSVPAYDRDKKQVDWPESASDTDQDVKDLHYLTIINLRGKGGPSGEPFDMVLSQRNGILEELSDFVFCKEYNWFGIEVNGNKTNYRLQLRPDVALQRTTVRTKLESKTDRKLAKACKFTAEMARMRYFGVALEPELRCTPAQLYEDLAKMGYDWELLLDTRDWYTFLVNEPYCKPYLHTYDLLRMRAGWYHPYWYPKTREEMGLPPITTVR